ncbi:MAG: SAM-dependent methyltransferase [Carbonactinosporaceae bacterium]
MSTEDWKDTFRPDIPSSARMYNYFLGGKDHYPADRDAAEEVLKVVPDIRTFALQNRAFLQRAVRFLAGEVGIRQFLDVGAGLPSAGNVHEVAQGTAPDTRVVYVDNDPVVLAHGRNMLHGVENTTILRYDLQNPEGILADGSLRNLLDLTEPVAVLLVAVVHFVTDAESPADIVRRLMDPLPSGSYLALTHGTADSNPKATEAAKVYERATSRILPRPRAEVEGFFAGLELAEPGLVWMPQWRPDQDTGLQDDPGRSMAYGGLARKP